MPPKKPLKTSAIVERFRQERILAPPSNIECPRNPLPPPPKVPVTPTPDTVKRPGPPPSATTPVEPVNAAPAEAITPEPIVDTVVDKVPSAITSRARGVAYAFTAILFSCAISAASLVFFPSLLNRQRVPTPELTSPARPEHQKENPSQPPLPPIVPFEPRPLLPLPPAIIPPTKEQAKAPEPFSPAKTVSELQGVFEGAEEDYKDQAYGRASLAYSITIRNGFCVRESYHNRGWCNLKLGDYSMAESDFTEAIALDHKCGKSYYGRGMARQNLGKLEASINDFHTARELDGR